MVISKKTIIFQGFRGGGRMGGSNIFRGRGVQHFPGVGGPNAIHF